MEYYIFVGFTFGVSPVEYCLDVIGHFGVNGFINELLCLCSEGFFRGFFVVCLRIHVIFVMGGKN